MSIRSMETGFNLRTIVADSAVAKPLVLTQVPAVNQTLQVTPVRSGLKFDLGQISKTQTHTISSVTSRSAQPSHMLHNPFAHKTNDVSSPGSMRLVAMLDDMKGRLKRAAERAVEAETKLHHTQVALKSERKTAAERIMVITGKLGESHAVQSNLKDELARLSKESERVAALSKCNSFTTTVKAATVDTDDEMQKSKAELDAMNATISNQNAQAERVALQITALRAEVSEANATTLQREQQLLSMEEKLVAAKDLGTTMLEERDLAVSKLEQANAVREVANAAPRDNVNSDVGTMASQMTTLQVDVSEANAKTLDLERQILSIEDELAASKDREATILKERDFAVSELAQTKASIDATALEQERQILSIENELSAAKDLGRIALEERDIAAAELRQATIDLEIATAAVATGCLPMPDTELNESPPELVVPITDASELPSSGVEPADNAPPAEEHGVTLPDPVEMHQRYHDLRNMVLKLTHDIAKLRHNNNNDELLSKTTETRNALYTITKQLKTSYDAMFGQVYTAPTWKDYHVLAMTDDAKTDDSLYSPIGCAPDPPNAATYVLQTARDCPIFGSVDFGFLDSGPGIGSASIAPVTCNGKVIGDSGEKTPMPTNGCDEKHDMVNAIVRDITNLLKYTKEQEMKERETTRANSLSHCW